MIEKQIQQAIRLQQNNQHKEASKIYNQILRVSPENCSVLVNNAITLRKQKKYSAAKIYYSRALSIRADNASTWSNYGNLLCDMMLFDEADAAFNQAISLEGETADNQYNKGNVPFNNNKPQDAIEFYSKVLQWQPDHHNARWNTALSYLQLGVYKEGFGGYEARFEKNSETRSFGELKRWNNESLAGRKILLSREQGLGDMIQFVRFACCLKDRGAEVFLETATPLKRFMFCVNGVDHVVDEGYMNSELDFYLPIMSLPFMLGISADDLEETTSYLDNEKFLAPAALPGDARVKVGLVWGSKPGHPSNRSCDLEMLLPLLENKDIDFYSFQKGEAVKDIYRLGVEGILYDLDQYMPDFYDTAAYMKQMDLIISIDSSPLHCAAALGINTWGLLLHASEWRWMLERDSSPWYPALKLFRQTGHNDWSEILENMFKEFEKEIKILQGI